MDGVKAISRQLIRLVYDDGLRISQIPSLNRVHLVFIIVTIIAAMTYKPRAQLFRWPQSTALDAIAVFRAIGFGLLGGVCALGATTPFLWFGTRRVGFIRSLIGRLSHDRDAIEVLLCRSAVHASARQLRAMFEAAVYLEWMLTGDLERKVSYYYVHNLLRLRRWALGVQSGTLFDREGYWARYPPSMTSSAPVMKLDSSEARKRQPFATSSGVPARFIGVRPMMLALMPGS